MGTELSEGLLIDNGYKPKSFILDYKVNNKDVIINGYIKDFDLQYNILDRFIFVKCVGDNFLLSFETKDKTPYMPPIEVYTIEDLNRLIDNFKSELTSKNQR